MDDAFRRTPRAAHRRRHRNFDSIAYRLLLLALPTTTQSESNLLSLHFMNR